MDLFKKWEAKYGAMYTYWFGETPVISIQDYETIIETFVKDGSAYEGRMDTGEFKDIFGSNLMNFFLSFTRLIRWI